MIYDCVIVGGGPAGLSAALLLGRCRRTVAVIDAGNARNPGPTAHGILMHDGSDPADLRRCARAQLVPYDVRVVDDEVIDVTVDPTTSFFRTTTRSGERLVSKKLLLATGMRDRMPDEAPFRERLGRDVFVCPFCDGWEMRDRKLVAYAPDATGVELALGLKTWSADVALVVRDGTIGEEDRARLSRNGVRIYEDVITSFETKGEALQGIGLRSGAVVGCDAIFVHFGEEQASPLAARLGCAFEENRTVRTKEGERGGPPGLFVAGDASHDLQLFTVAIAEGVKAACAMNTELRRDAER